MFAALSIGCGITIYSTGYYKVIFFGFCCFSITFSSTVFFFVSNNGYWSIFVYFFSFIIYYYSYLVSILTFSCGLETASYSLYYYSNNGSRFINFIGFCVFYTTLNSSFIAGCYNYSIPGICFIPLVATGTLTSNSPR